MLSLRGLFSFSDALGVHSVSHRNRLVPPISQSCFRKAEGTYIGIKYVNMNI